MSAQFRQIGNGAIGCNIGEMEQLAAELRQTDEKIEQIFKQVDAKVSATSWSGPDATRQANEWNQARVSVMNMIRGFVECTGRAISAQASQQQQTSQS